MQNEQYVYGAFERSLGYTFEDRTLLREAFTHASHTNEYPKDECYERLEFLGDAVVELMVTTWLYALRPKLNEGRMTRARAMVVSEESLSALARRLGMDGYIRLGRGTRQLNAAHSSAVLCDVFESVTGAIYLDGGMDEAKRVMLPYLEERLKYAVSHELERDYKTRLQELLQAEGQTYIEYVLTDTRGPAHMREFEFELRREGIRLSTGVGHSKKAAQQCAAKAALELLTGETHET